MQASERADDRFKVDDNLNDNKFLASYWILLLTCSQDKSKSVAYTNMSLSLANLSDKDEV